MTERADPVWVRVLRERCQATSQKKVADELGISAPVVSQILNHSYGGRWKNIQDRVEGAYMGHTVNCPVLGELPTNKCLDYQKLPFVSANPQRVRLRRACRTCPNNIGEG